MKRIVIYLNTIGAYKQFMEDKYTWYFGSHGVRVNHKEKELMIYIPYTSIQYIEEDVI